MDKIKIKNKIYKLSNLMYSSNSIEALFAHSSMASGATPNDFRVKKRKSLFVLSHTCTLNSNAISK